MVGDTEDATVDRSHQEEQTSVALSVRQVGADQLPVVAGEHVAVCESWVGPAHAAAFVELVARRIDQLGAAQLVEPLRGEEGDEELKWQI